MYKRALGSDYPDALTAQGNLASSTGQAGDTAAARDQYAELLPLRERALGPEHPDTLTAWHEFARWTGLAGDTGAARDLLAKLLPSLERVHGPEHPNTLEARRPNWRAHARPRRPKVAQRLKIGRFLYRHPASYRSVRDLGLVTARCPGESGTPEGCSSPWLPASLPGADPRPSAFSGVPYPGLLHDVRAYLGAADR